MQYLGVPTCPYCKKRVNIIRTWSLKRQGEYKCPRCGGISNIFLSPLVYVLAAIAILSGGAIYFFHKFILDDISLSTAFQVFLPFAAFFFLSLFMVYLAKPVIKKVSREEMEKKRRRGSVEERRRMGNSGRRDGTGNEFTDHGDYMPKTDYHTGPVPIQPIEERSHLSPPTPVRKLPERQNDLAQTSVIPLQKKESISHFSPVPQIEPPTRHVEEIPPKRATSAAPSRTSVSSKTQSSAKISTPAPSSRLASVETGKKSSGSTADPEKKFRVVSSVEIPSSGGNLFSKYDDPTYVEQRLKEINNGKK